MDVTEDIIICIGNHFVLLTAVLHVIVVILNNLVYHLFTVEINRINGNRLRVILVSISHFIKITFIRNRAGCHKGCHQLL